MSDIQRLIKMLQSDKLSKRYNACEEMMVLPSLPPEALEALRLAAKDTNSSVADAAHRALALHTPKKTLDAVESKKESYAELWFIRLIFAVLGFLAGGNWGFSVITSGDYFSLFSLLLPLVGGIVGVFVGWFIGKVLESTIDYFINYYNENREKAK